MLKSLLKILLVSLLGTIVVALFDVPLNDPLPSILFTVCGIFFSVGMSQLMTYDLSKILNERFFQTMKKSIHKIRKLFVMQFVCCSVAYLGLEILTVYSAISFKITVKGVEFSLVRFLNVMLIYCLIYFIINFQELLKNKFELDSKIRQETIDE